jgi:bacteriocin biosynthesis cyclodehydratase domain-containing protein
MAYSSVSPDSAKALAENARIRLKRHYSVVAHSADVVELRHGVWNPISFTLTDEGGSGNLLRVLRRLDGTSTVAEIAATEGIARSEVVGLTDQLGELGVLEDGSSHALDYYLDHVVPNLAQFGGERVGPRSPLVLLGDAAILDHVQRTLDQGEIGVELELAENGMREQLARGASPWLSDGLALEAAAAAFAVWQGKQVVFATTRLNPLEFEAFNSIALYHRIPWIHAAVDGPFLLVGPTFVPGRSPCYECLEARVLMNLREAASYQRYKHALAEDRISLARGALDAVLGSLVGSLVAFEALNFALTGAAFTVGKMLALYLPTMEFTFNEVLRLPGCRACAPSPEGDDRELYFDIRTLLDGRGPSVN